MKKNLLKKCNIVFLLIAISLLPISKAQTASCPSWGPYLEGFDMTNSGEVWYSEVMVDNASKQKNTYYSTLNYSLGPRGGYAGIQYKAAEIYNNIFSIWDLQDSNTPQCTAEYAAPDTFVDGFGGEGTGLHTDNPMPWTPEVWYATVIRRWSIGDGQTRIGFFMYSYGTQKWKHYATLITPENDAKFTGTKLGGFLENWNPSASKATRSGYYRNFWGMNAQGNWSKPSHYNASAGEGSWGAQPAFNNTAIKMTSCGTTPAPSGGSVNFNINQAGTKPSTIIPVKVTNVSPTYSGGTVNVAWVTSDTTSPQLSYTVKLYTQASWNNGYTPIKTVSGIRPDKRSVSIPLPANSSPGKYYVSVELKDIFNQASNFGYNSIDINSVQTHPQANIYYRIKNVGSNLYISPKDYSNTSNTYLVQQGINNNQAQQWKFESVGGNFVIVNRSSGLVIDVPDGNTSNGRSLVQYSRNNGYNQQWSVKQVASGGYNIISSLSNVKFMDNPGNSQNPGTNVIIWDQNNSGAQNQLWVLEPVNTSNKNAVTSEALITENRLLVYPNPVKQGEMVYINLPEQDSYELKIVNIEGLTVNSQNVRGGKASVSTSGLRSGVYFYNAKSTTQTISGKFTVQ